MLNKMQKKKKQKDSKKPKRYDLVVPNNKAFGQFIQEILRNDRYKQIREELIKFENRIYSTQKPAGDKFSDHMSLVEEYVVNPSMWDKHPLFKSSDADVTDNDFFELIKENPIFLGFRFVQQKIKRWREELHDTDKDKIYNAQENLKKIGANLELKGRDKQRTSETLVASVRDDILSKLNANGISKLRNIATKKMKLKELFPEHVDIIGSLNFITTTDKVFAELRTDKSISITNKKLAELLTAKIFGLKGDVVRAYLKRVQRIDHGGKTPAYILKKPR